MLVFDLLAHGSGSEELALLCVKCKEMGLPVSYCKVDDPDMSIFLEAKFALSEVLEMIQSEREIIHNKNRAEEILKDSQTVVAISSPNQYVAMKRFDAQNRCFFRHGLNSYTKFSNTGCKNFWSINPNFSKLIPYPINFFLAKKYLFFPYFIMKRKILNFWHKESKSGFISLISHYQKQHAKEFQQFEELIKLVSPTKLVNYGHESPDGWVNDLDELSKSLGLVHIKNRQIGCNAVIRALAMGKPIFALKENVKNLCLSPYVIHKKTAFLGKTIPDVARMMRTYQELSLEERERMENFIVEQTKIKCSPQKRDLVSFFEFLIRCLPC